MPGKRRDGGANHRFSRKANDAGRLFRAKKKVGATEGVEELLVEIAILDSELAKEVNVPFHSGPGYPAGAAIFGANLNEVPATIHRRHDLSREEQSVYRYGSPQPIEPVSVCDNVPLRCCGLCGLQNLAPDWRMAPVGRVNSDAEQGIVLKFCAQACIPPEAYDAAPAGSHAINHRLGGIRLTCLQITYSSESRCIANSGAF